MFIGKNTVFQPLLEYFQPVQSNTIVLLLRYAAIKHSDTWCTVQAKPQFFSSLHRPQNSFRVVEQSSGFCKPGKDYNCLSHRILDKGRVQ